MKQILIAFLTLASTKVVVAQSPVQWKWSAVKVNDNEYDVKLLATIQSGWHLYSQKQPVDAIALPTEIIINKNPLVELKEKVKEQGQLEKYKDKTLDVEAWQYSDKVEFVQRVKLKAKVKTAISGTVEYQVCTDEKCLPPARQLFTVSLD